MKLFKSGVIAFSLTVAASIAVHAAVIGWVTKLPVPGLWGPADPGSISARIISEAREGRKTGPAKGVAAGPPASPPASGPEEASAGNTGTGPAAQAGDRRGAAVIPTQEPGVVETAAMYAPTKDVQIDKPAVSAAVSDQAKPQPVTIPVPGILRASRERFFFEIYWMGVYVGKAALEAGQDNGIQRITSQVHSAPVISAFYKVEDFAESTVRGNAPVRFRIKQREGKYRSDKETLFDAGGGVTYFDHRKGIKEEHPPQDKVLYDVISGFFYLRTQPMEIGKTVLLDVFDSNKFLVTEVNVLRNERVSFLGKETETVVVRPVLKSDGLFQSKGDIFIWLTNDERRIPVRVETKVGIGMVVAELKGMEREP